MHSKRRPSFQVSRWDRFLIGVAPEFGLRRLRARAAATMIERHYDAAASGRRTAGWHRSSSDANAAAGPSLASLRELSRDLRRNNGWARRGVQVIANNTIGWGIKANAVAQTPELATMALKTWDAWADSALCDYDGRMPFAGLQKLVMRTIVESGEALVMFEPASSDDGLSVPLRVRVLEPDYLDTLKDGLQGEAGGPIVQGIEFDGRGRRVAYWIFAQHPGSTRVFNPRFESKRVPAADVLHIYDVERAGQARGVPWLASAIAKMNDLDDFEDAALMQQKIAACFGAFVQDLDADSSPLGEPDDDDEHIETLEPGHIEYLPPGKTVTFATPPASPNTTFTASQLRRIAASLGVTYEDLTGDYSMVNFSSARMARISHWANIHAWRWEMVIPQLCDGVWRRVIGFAASLQGWPEIPRATWAPPPMPMIEPEKEGLAYSRLIRNGVKTLPQVIRELGEDPDKQVEEIAASNAKLDELKIILDCDPRRTSAAGLTQERVGKGAGAASGEDDEGSEKDA